MAELRQGDGEPKTFTSEETEKRCAGKGNKRDTRAELGIKMIAWKQRLRQEGEGGAISERGILWVEIRNS